MSDGLNSALEMSENRISELEHRSIEFIPPEQKRENRKNYSCSKTSGTITKDLTFVSLESQEMRKNMRLNNYLKK